MNGIFLPLLALLFIGLKLGNVIAWSWLWVLAPLWIPAVIILFILLIWLCFMGLALATFGGLSKRINRRR